MHVEQIFWDLEDDKEGNYWHIVIEGHGITKEEVEEVLSDPGNPTDHSRSSDENITFGHTSSGKYIAVVWNEVTEDPLAVYPITAYEVPPPARKNKKGRKKR